MGGEASRSSRRASASADLSLATKCSEVSQSRKAWKCRCFLQQIANPVSKSTREGEWIPRHSQAFPAELKHFKEHSHLASESYGP